MRCCSPDETFWAPTKTGTSAAKAMPAMRMVTSSSTKVKPWCCSWNACLSSFFALRMCFGEASERTAREFLQRGWVSVLASDAHDLEARPPRIASGRDAAAQIVGEDEARRLVQDIPSSIVRGA